MYFLDIVTTVCIGLLIGVEFAVSVFINPTVWKLDDRAQATAIGLFAKRLGAAMPLWYAVSLLLLGLEAFLRHHESGFGLLVVASVIWAVVIVLTVLFLVVFPGLTCLLTSLTQADCLDRKSTRLNSSHSS